MVCAASKALGASARNSSNSGSGDRPLRSPISATGAGELPPVPSNRVHTRARNFRRALPRMASVPIPLLTRTQMRVSTWPLAPLTQRISSCFPFSVHVADISTSAPEPASSTLGTPGGSSLKQIPGQPYTIRLRV